MEKHRLLHIISVLLTAIIFLLFSNVSYASVADSDEDGVPNLDNNGNVKDICPGSMTAYVNPQGCSCSQTGNCPPSCPTTGGGTGSCGGYSGNIPSSSTCLYGVNHNTG